MRAHQGPEVAFQSQSPSGREGDRPEHRELEQEIDSERQVERTVVPPRPLDVAGGKQIRSVHVEVRELSDI